MNNSLNSVSWNKFPLGDLFNIERGSAKNITTKINGNNVALISAIDKNNGLFMFANAAPNEKIYKNVYTVNNNGNGVCLSFYHKYTIESSSDVSILIPKDSRLEDEDVALFITTVIKQQKSKYNYGYKMSNPRMAKQMILLPVDSHNNINFIFIKKYISSQKKIKIDKYLKNCKKQISLINIEKEFDLQKDIEWKNFRVLDIFDYRRGNQNNMNSLIAGQIPLISAKNIDNGLKGFFEKNNKNIFSGNCLTLNNDGDGGVSLSYYQPFNFLLDTHVYALYPKIKLNKYVLLFISLSLSKQKRCYSHGYSISQDRLEKMRIVLPCKKDVPDYDYMENYTKRVFVKLLSRYIENKQIL